jgi:hypothetical protein
LATRLIEKKIRIRSVSWEWTAAAARSPGITGTDRFGSGQGVENDMSFIESAKNTGRGLAIAAAVVAAGSLTVAPSAAYARNWDHGGHWGGHHWDGGHRHGGGGVALGLLGGALAGAAIASAANSYYNPYYYSYSYGSPYYSPYGYYAPY